MDRREFSAGAAALAGAGLASSLARAAPGAISSAARSLWRRSIVLDCNIGPQFSQTTFPLPRADLDIARASGLTALKTSIGGFNASFEDTVAEIGFYQRVFEAHPANFMQIRTVADLATAKRAGKLGIIFGFENAACLEDKVDRIEVFRFLGVRVMQLSYNLTSPFGAGVLAPADATLTELGRQAVAKMNEVGVALDLSYANAATTAAAMAASKRPVIMTHAGCAAIHPHPRNKTDDQLRRAGGQGRRVGNLRSAVPDGEPAPADARRLHDAHDPRP